MFIRPALVQDAQAVYRIAKETISAVYPRYYPRGAVDFFLHHHNPDAILRDIETGCVYLAVDEKDEPAGTVTVRENEILRLFVLPGYQGMGNGKMLLDFAEKTVAKQFDTIIIDASLPAKSLYLKRGYREIKYHQLPTGNGDFLCYDVMKKDTCAQLSSEN